MAFNITAQVVLSGPKNLNQVTKNISSSLSKAGSFKLNIDPKAASALNNINKSVITLTNSYVKLNQQIQTAQSTLNKLGTASRGVSSNLQNVSSQQNKLQSQTTKTNQSLQTQSSLMTKLGGRFKNVALQAFAFGAISRPVFELQRALAAAVKDAIAFEKEIVKISQVTGRTAEQLSSLRSEINNLSVSLGISANELAETTRIIAQAGIRGKDLEQVLSALARSTLAPTFGKITDTTEGLIAAFGQFGLSGRDAEAILGSLNRVSKEFAVEAEDLISVIRRTGGVFAAAAGDSKGTVTALQELISVFTAVRSTTRESADTIAAGLRTIFSRIQRRSTINFLKQFGIDLVDAKGNFVGIFPAFDLLSDKLGVLIRQGDALTLSAIAEELGGIRQIGKLLPAIANFDKARKALEQAQRGAAEGLSGDVGLALDTIDNRLKRVKESFGLLIRNVFESTAFQSFAKNVLKTTESFIKLADSIVGVLEPVLPLLTALGTIKISGAIGGAIGSAIGGGGIRGVLGGGSGGAAAQASTQAMTQATQQSTQATTSNGTKIDNLANILTKINVQLANLISINNSGFNNLISLQKVAAARPATTVPVAGFGGATGRRKSGGGKIYGFARGGIVPGQGNGDTVPAMLEPGEFVIKKSSVGSIGAGTLEAMNNNKMQGGGRSRSIRESLDASRKTKAYNYEGGKPITDKSTKGILTAGTTPQTQAKINQLADMDKYAAAFLRPEARNKQFFGELNPAELKKATNAAASQVKFSGKIGKLTGTTWETKQNDIAARYAARNKFSITAGSLTSAEAGKLEDVLIDGIVSAAKSGAQSINQSLGIKGNENIAKALRSANYDQTIGNLFELTLANAGAPFGSPDTDPANALSIFLIH